MGRGTGASFSMERCVRISLIYWRWKSRRLRGRPQIETELRALIGQMSTENLFWGAPRIHGELLKLGFSVAQSLRGKATRSNGSNCDMVKPLPALHLVGP